MSSESIEEFSSSAEESSVDRRLIRNLGLSSWMQFPKKMKNRMMKLLRSTRKICLKFFTNWLMLAGYDLLPRRITRGM